MYDVTTIAGDSFDLTTDLDLKDYIARCYHLGFVSPFDDGEIIRPCVAGAEVQVSRDHRPEFVRGLKAATGYDVIEAP